MFSGFSQATQDFLWGLLLNNERPWFEAHRADYQTHLQIPFKELALDVSDEMQRRFPELSLTLHVARIYRDARRLHGRGPYKEHLWFSLSDAGWLSDTCFWFELGAADYSFGLGLYCATPAQMDGFRKSIDANLAGFSRLVQDLARDGRFHPDSETYKRPKGDRGPLLNPWYNMKHISAAHTEEFGPALFSPELPRQLADGFSALVPLYLFIRDACGTRPADTI